MTSAPRRRRRRSRVLLVAALLLGLLAGGEIVVRVLGLVDVTAGVPTEDQAAFYRAGMLESVDDPRLGYRNRPGARMTTGGVTYRHDAHGWRTDAAAATREGCPAVVFLGDSTTYGWGVPNEDTLPEQVAALLEHRILPLNLGVNGYATPQEVAAYEQARAELEDTPLVVLVVYPNDAVDRAFLWDDANGALYVDALPVPHAWKRWLWKSGLYRGLASWHGDRLAARGELDSREENLPALLAEVERLARLVDGDGRQLVVVHLPGMVELDPYPYSWLTVALAATCERLSVPFVDLLDAFLAERERLVAEYEDSSGERVDPLAYRNFLSRYWLVPGRDHHLDAAGNRVAASALAAALAPLLP